MFIAELILGHYREARLTRKVLCSWFDEGQGDYPVFMIRTKL